MQITENQVEGVKTTETTELVITNPRDNIDAEVRRIADIIKPAAKAAFDSNGTGNLGKTLYTESLLPADLTPEVVQRFMGHHRAVQAGMALGVGEAGFEFMQANPDIKAVRADLPTFGKDHYAVKVEQSRNVAGTMSYGIVKVSHELHGTGKNDPMVQVKDVLSNQARDLWAKL